jgi:predicted lipoprotein
MKPTHALALLAGMAWAAPASAAPPDPGPLAVRVIEQAVLPRYDALAEATARQAEDWARACADGDFGPEADGLKDDYQTAADAWAAVEFVTTGPIGESLRADRVFFGPDRRNYVSKAVAELATRAKDAELTADAMRSASVAGQGFPALERVLYEPGDAPPAGQCRIGSAIARNLTDIAADIPREWRAPEGPLEKLRRGEGDRLHFADPQQAAARLLTDLAGGVQRMVDLKLLPVLGSSADAAKPKAAEGWRSGRSARALSVTVASLGEMAKIFAASAPPEVAKADDKAFEAARAAVAKLPADLGEAAADPKRRRALEVAVAALKAAQADVVKNVAPALGLPLGFNALDGD